MNGWKDDISTGPYFYFSKNMDEWQGCCISSSIMFGTVYQYSRLLLQPFLTCNVEYCQQIITSPPDSYQWQGSGYPQKGANNDTCMMTLSCKFMT